jgi:flagellar basal-body rod protein FlgC
MFDSLGIAATGMTVHRRWMDAVSDNIANINTVRPMGEEAFRERYVIAQAAEYGSGRGGARVAGVTFGDPVGRPTYEPEHPLADEAGLVRRPDIDMGEQMTSLIMAQRGYQASVAVVERAREAYSAAVQLGRR